MDRSRFTEAAPGQLWEIATESGRDWTFIPAALPEHWELPKELLGILVAAREELARLDGVGRYMGNYNLLLRPLQRREALRSSSLEGTYATPQQLLLFEIEQRQPTSIHDPASEWQEVWNYNRALDMAVELLETRPISLNLMRTIHRQLLSGVRGSRRDPGNFRRTQVYIGSDKRFIPPPPPEMMAGLDRLEKFVHQNQTLDPLILCFMVHYQFETIHPFLDGNGRVGRLLLSLMIYEKLKLSKPWLYLSAFFDRYKDEYVSLLFQVSARGNWQDWIAFCLRGTVAQSQDALARFDRLLTLREQYREMLGQIGGSIRLNRLLDRLFESPAVTVSQYAEMCEIHYNTARSDVRRLVAANILAESTLSARPRVYFAPEIVAIAYGD